VLVVCCVVLCCTMLYYVVLCCTMLYYVALCCTMLLCVLYCGVWCCVCDRRAPFLVASSGLLQRFIPLLTPSASLQESTLVGSACQWCHNEETGVGHCGSSFAR
jgi:hypothetical protein